jgi:hypothetical protein
VTRIRLEIVQVAVEPLEEQMRLQKRCEKPWRNEAERLGLPLRMRTVIQTRIMMASGRIKKELYCDLKVEFINKDGCAKFVIFWGGFANCVSHKKFSDFFFVR